MTEDRADTPKVEVPIAPPLGLLVSMALRYDHGLFRPANDPDNPFCTYTEEERANRIRSVISMMRQIHEEIVGTGFYRPEKEADYAAWISPPPSPTDKEG